MIDASKPKSSPVEGTHTAAAAPGAADPAAGAQLGLLPAEAEAVRDRLLPLPEAAKPRDAAKGRGGRPAGARNRRTDLMAQYLVDRYGDPLEGHVSLGMMPLKEFIRAMRIVASEVGISLGMTVMDAVRLQADLRSQALPYIHAKRAPEDHKGDPVLPVVGIGQYVDNRTQIAAGSVSIEDRLAQAKTIDNKGENDEDAK